MATWKPRYVGDSTVWIEPPPRSERNWTTYADYERNHQHARACGEQISDVLVEWLCGCGGRQYSFDPPYSPLGSSPSLPDEPVYVEDRRSHRAIRRVAPQPRRSSGPFWLLLLLLVTIVITVLAQLH